MKIYTQDRKSIIEIGRKTWVAENYVEGECALLTSTPSEDAEVLGMYSTPAEAYRILGDIHTAIRTAKATHVMPEKEG